MDDQNQQPSVPSEPDANKPADTPVTPESMPVSPSVATPNDGPVGVYSAPVTPVSPTPGYSYTPAKETNAWAIVSLVASILSWVGLFGLGGIVGVICGVIARGQIRESNGRQEGDGIAIAGIVLGGVNIALSCIAILCVFATFAGIFSMPIFFGNGR
jgi:hypothetical protein